MILYLCRYIIDETITGCGRYTRHLCLGPGCPHIRYVGCYSGKALTETRSLTTGNIEEIKKRSNEVLESLERLQISSLLAEIKESEQRMATLLNTTLQDSKESTDTQIAALAMDQREIQKLHEGLNTQVVTAISTQNELLSTTLLEFQAQATSASEAASKSAAVRSWAQAGALGILIVVAIFIIWVS